MRHRVAAWVISRAHDIWHSLAWLQRVTAWLLPARCSPMSPICAGCPVPDAVPEEGDVRLVTLNGTSSNTAACDDVHFGGVELFREGRWGRICTGVRFDAADHFTLDAQVVCRQLGFPFGTLMDEGTVFDRDYGSGFEYELYSYQDDTAQDYDYSQAVTWATEVLSITL